MSTAFDELEAEMQEQRQRLRAALTSSNEVEVQASRAELQRLEAAWHALTGKLVVDAADRATPSMRERVLQTLSLIGSPASQTFILSVHRVFYGAELNGKAMVSLRRDEQRSLASTGNHRVYVCAALTADRFGVARGLLAHSAWPLEERIIAPTSRRVNLLRAITQITEAAERLPTTNGTAHAVHNLFRGIPEIPEYDVTDTPVDLQELHARAKQALALELRPDIRARSAAARRARQQLDPVQQLFGASRH
ncbi:hypothetical protein ACIQU4_27725 [Streptomyces sp. NPDC090741]|uniref:hypothetical protein n=1 Tax=Streptomyces sp. NPDC090741 TaxID=3365967 RepID=UPI00380B5698